MVDLDVTHKALITSGHLELFECAGPAGRLVADPHLLPRSGPPGALRLERLRRTTQWSWLTSSIRR